MKNHAIKKLFESVLGTSRSEGEERIVLLFLQHVANP
jgi:hypothetical protein